MIHVCRIRVKTEEYRSFVDAGHRGTWMIGGWDCRSRAATWSPPEVHSFRPFLEPGDFYNWKQDVLITSPRATDELLPHLKAAGELLPLSFGGQVYTVLNIAECVDCLDDEDTMWRWTVDGSTRIKPETYVFDPDRLPRKTTLFKIPQTSTAELLLVEGFRRPDEEFRQSVERAGLRGLEFVPLWASYV